MERKADGRRTSEKNVTGSRAIGRVPIAAPEQTKARNRATEDKTARSAAVRPETAEQKVARLSENFAACSKMLAALGDETRQHLILEMMKMGQCRGVRVGAITEKTNLSRPAVSHHLKIMKDAGLVSVRKEGTMNFYYFDPETDALERLADTLRLAAEITGDLPDRSGAAD